MYSCVFRVDFTQPKKENKKKQQDLQEKMAVNLAVFLCFLLFSTAFKNLPEWHSDHQTAAGRSYQASSDFRLRPALGELHPDASSFRSLVR